MSLRPEDKLREYVKGVQCCRQRLLHFIPALSCWGLANLISDAAACGEPLGLLRLDASD